MDRRRLLLTLGLGGLLALPFGCGPKKQGGGEGNAPDEDVPNEMKQPSKEAPDEPEAK